MAEHRFILSAEHIQMPYAYLEGENFQHFKTLRLTKHDAIFIVDDKGCEYHAELLKIEKRRAEVRLHDEIFRQTESNLELTLFQGLTKGSKLEFVIQKATELGVTAIVPVITEYSQIKLQPDREQKSRRWQEVARQATRQSGRTKVPFIHEPIEFMDCQSNQSENELTLLFHNIKKYKLKSWGQIVERTKHIKKINLFVGPEGGFSDKEVEQAIEKKWLITGLGPRVLRAETAGIISVALAQLTWGDIDR